MYSYRDISGVVGVMPNGSLFTDECESIDTSDLMAFHSSFIPDDGRGTSASYKLERFHSPVP